MTGRTIQPSLIAVACIAAVLLAGCTAPAEKPLPTSPVPTPVETGSLPSAPSSFDQASNGGTYSVSTGDVFRLDLPENPSTGYAWNLSVSPGISILNDSYVPSDVTGRLVGSGGTRIWFLEATLPGEQVVSGTYRRPWEPAGNETTFMMTLDVEEGTCGVNVCPLPTVPVSVPPRYQVYTEGDNAGTVEEPPGGTFTIRLQENPTTGYSWNLSLPGGITLSRDEFIPSATGGQIMGSGGVRSFTLVAGERGEWNITAEYRRPWVPAGTVTRVDFGGFYGILGDDGKRYEPLNLDPKYEKDGLRVAFEATIANTTSGTGTWGTPVTLGNIEEIPGFSLRVIVG